MNEYTTYIDPDREGRRWELDKPRALPRVIGVLVAIIVLAGVLLAGIMAQGVG